MTQKDFEISNLKTYQAKVSTLCNDSNAYETFTEWEITQNVIDLEYAKSNLEDSEIEDVTKLYNAFRTHNSPKKLNFTEFVETQYAIMTHFDMVSEINRINEFFTFYDDEFPKAFSRLIAPFLIKVNLILSDEWYVLYNDYKRKLHPNNIKALTARIKELYSKETGFQDFKINQEIKKQNQVLSKEFKMHLIEYGDDPFLILIIDMIATNEGMSWAQLLDNIEIVRKKYEQNSTYSGQIEALKSFERFSNDKKNPYGDY